MVMGFNSFLQCKMKPLQHQEQGASKALSLLKKHRIVYIAWEERTCKSLTAILTAEQSTKQINVLIVSKKNALEGWADTLDKFSHKNKYTLINYESLHKIKGSFDLLILDESHNFISGFAKPSTSFKKLKPLAKGKPLIYVSATPNAQTTAQLFHQFALSSFSPWAEYKSFYSWWRNYGTGETTYTPYGVKKAYDKVYHDRVMADVKHLFMYLKRSDVPELATLEPSDEIHWIDLDTVTKSRYNRLLKNKVLGSYMADSVIKVRTALHQLEGGSLKFDESRTFDLKNQEKIDYILSHWGDNEDVAIMFYFKGELTKLKKHFKKALLLQSTSYAEGVDLHHIRHLIIYSQDYSTARHNQRRCRQVNKERTEQIIVHFLLVKGGVSEQIYETVSINKTNFIDKYFQERGL